MSSQLLEYIKQETKKVLQEKEKEKDEPSILDFFGKDTKNSIKKLKSKLDAAAGDGRTGSEKYLKLSNRADKLFAKIEKLEKIKKKIMKGPTPEMYALSPSKTKLDKAKKELDITLKAITKTPEGQKVAKMFSPEAALAFGQKMGDKADKKLQGSGGSGRKRKRHPLRAKQERLSRRIKVPVAKIQDMLKPYFSGGGKVTFKESINRNIILEGDGAYGDETEAAIKAFQAQVNDLIEKDILKGVKPLGTPDGLFGPASLRAFNALKKQPEALAQSKLGSAQVDPNTLAGGAKQAAAQAAAGAKPAAKQTVPGLVDGFAGATLGTSTFWKNDMKNIPTLNVNQFKGYGTFGKTISEMWDEYSNDDVNEENLPYLKEFAIMMMNALAQVPFPDEKSMADIYKMSKEKMYKDKSEYYIGVMQNFDNSIRKSKWVEKIFQDLNTLQVYFKGAGKEGIAKAVNQTAAPIKNKVVKDAKKAKDSPYTDVDNAAMAASKAGVAADQARMQSYSTADAKPQESKVYAYLEKLINEEFDKILG